MTRMQDPSSHGLRRYRILAPAHLHPTQQQQSRGIQQYVVYTPREPRQRGLIFFLKSPATRARGARSTRPCGARASKINRSHIMAANARGNKNKPLFSSPHARTHAHQASPPKTPARPNTHRKHQKSPRSVLRQTKPRTNLHPPPTHPPTQKSQPKPPQPHPTPPGVSMIKNPAKTTK